MEVPDYFAVLAEFERMRKVLEESKRLLAVVETFLADMERRGLKEGENDGT